MESSTATPPPAPAGRSLLRRRLVDPISALLSQGLTPERLAASVAIGAAIGVFPIIGTTTAICAVIALASGLNIVAIQAGNYIVFPLQFLLIVPFMRLGERLTGAVPVPLSAETIAMTFRLGVWHALTTLSGALWHAVVGWLAAGPLAALLLSFALRPMLRRSAAALAARRKVAGA